jgi:glutathione S-transferase
VQQLLALPSLQQWYSAALAETWRDAEHEDEVRAVGVWTQDLRAS